MTKFYTPVRARYVTYRNGKAYMVRYGKKANGNWVTNSYKAGEEAERDMWIKDHNANLDKNNPHTLSKFSKKQISEIQHVYAKLDEYGIGLTEAVDGFIERTSPISLRTKLSEALKVFERVQRFEKVKEKTISNARHSVYNRFIRTLKDKPVGLVTKEDIREFLGTGNDNTRMTIKGGSRKWQSP